jgi:hypothetical protein
MKNIIAQHIPNSALNIRVYDLQKETDSHTLCAFTGKPIQFACLKKDVIGANFTDHAFLRYPSAYVDVDIAKLILPTIQGNSLRNYSFYANQTELRLLKREDILPLLDCLETPFILGVTFSNKKHIGFKTTPQYNSDKFRIYTDIGKCEFDRQKHTPILEVMKRWYTIIAGKAHTEAQPTYFTKANILGETLPNANQIQAYGEERYFEENTIIEPIRNTLILKVLCQILNKNG